MGTVDSQQKRGKAVDKCVGGGERVVVAVKASKEISSTALVWALTHVVQPGDSITLLAVVPAHSSGRKLWGFPFFAGDCASGHRRSHTGTTPEQKSDITDLCSQMMHQLHDIYDPSKINVKVKIISGSPCGSVAAESKQAEASWVVLDEQLESEKKRCREELQCNIVAMKRSQPKVLRLNLVRSLEANPGLPCVLPPEVDASRRKNAKDLQDSRPTRGPSVTPTSSPEIETPFSTTEVGTSSVSSSDPATSPLFVSDTNESLQKEERAPAAENDNLNVTSSDSDSESLSPSTAPDLQPWVAEVLSGVHTSSNEIEDLSQRLNEGTHISKSRIFSHKFTKHDRNSAISTLNYRSDVDLGNVREGGSSKPNYITNSNFGGSSRERVVSSPDCKSELAFSRHMKEGSIMNSRLGTEFGSVREAVSLSRNAPSGPPPLCSVCQHKAPVFGKPPRWFSYTELELSTGGFSQANFLAEGGFGSVHRGILPDGQVIAVKQHKPASSQGDNEFCSEVDVLSCAQHRNVVTLIGFCVEDRRRLLVYEYICNGSLHSHLYGHSREPLEWSARQKVALGAARGLRYLHEECRVGCIVHRDMRPNNILLTHDFQALVGDFGLARWQPDGELGEETRVIGTIGYLAPEYSQTGQITEKADVYSFGVVLVELITGRKAVDIYRPKGQQLLTEWARPLLEEHTMCELIDPRLGNSYSEREVYCMLRAASLCIRREPHARPRMSQVLRILEGDEPSNISTSGYDPGSRRERSTSYDSGSRSGRLCPDQQQQPQFSSSQQHQTPRDSLKKRSHEGLTVSWEIP